MNVQECYWRKYLDLLDFVVSLPFSYHSVFFDQYFSQVFNLTAVFFLVIFILGDG